MNLSCRLSDSGSVKPTVYTDLSIEFLGIDNNGPITLDTPSDATIGGEMNFLLPASSPTTVMDIIISRSPFTISADVTQDVTGYTDSLYVGYFMYQYV